jgi:hypothetical protein
MAWSKLDIINLAFNQLNKKSVNDLSEAGEFADSANRGFDVLYKAELSTFSWRFNVHIQQLSALIPEAPAPQWKYQLALPADYLALVRTYPRVDFMIYENQLIYANVKAMKVEYRRFLDPTHLPAYFVRYFSILLAAYYAGAVASKSELKAQLNKEAFDMRGEALFTDAQSHPSPAIVSRPLIDARNSGHGFYGSGW